MKPRWLLGVGLALLILLAIAWLLHSPGTSPPQNSEPANAPWFVDVTQDSGLTFRHDPGPPPTDRYFMPQIMGSGAALFDFDNDGRLDIYLVQNAGPKSRSVNRLFHQGANGRFVDVSDGSGLDIAGFGMGVAVGDVTNDGLPEVCVTEYGSTRLFLNLGSGKFREITQEAGIDNPVWGASASFVDYDRDGWLDLVIVNYVDFNPAQWCGPRAGKQEYCHPNNFAPLAPRLFHHRGRPPAAPGEEAATIHFDDVTVSSGLARFPGAGLGVVCADFNGDRWPDIFLANDNQSNRLWINQQDGTFVEEALERGVAFDGSGRALGNMGVALGDVDGTGRFALFSTHLAEEVNTLWKQGADGFFHDDTGPAGLATPLWRATGFGTIFADFDQDGALDLAVVNGRVVRAAGRPEGANASFFDLYAERNQLFANNGAGRFRDVSAENDPFCGTAAVSRGLAWGDVDGDGAVDLLVTVIGGPARLYRNAVPNGGHWLLVRAIDPAQGGRDAYGALVTVSAGERRWVGLVNPGQSYLCSGDPRVHFGLGSIDHVDAIHVIWPDGTEQEFPPSAVDQQLTLRKTK